MNGQTKPVPESQLQVAIGTILEVLSDKSSTVAEAANSSLKKLAEKHPNQVLNSCITFCNKKPSTEHVRSILYLMETVCIDYIIQIDGDTVLLVIDSGLQIMTESPNFEVIQNPACDVLVALGRKHHIQVMDTLTQKLEPGMNPHYMIPHTLGALANVNAYGVVPYLKNILSVLLPLLGGIKADIYKQSFSFALGSFCDALLEYVSNIDRVPDNTITVDLFHLEMGMAYEVLVTSWLQSRDSKVIESVLISITSIFPVLSVEKVTLHTAKLVHTLLTLYKKHLDAYHITKCLESVISKAANVDGTLLEPLLNNILQNLCDLVCVSPDYAQPDSLRTHSEVLRCYECFALHFTDITIDQLIGQLKNNNDREKIKGLLILTHLTSYANNQIVERRLKDVIKHFNDLLNEPNIKVKKALLKIIVAFASKGILLNKELNDDGPEKYMEFIVKLCCTQAVSKNNDVDIQEIQDLQKSADNTLCMLSTSVIEMESVLWNLLMQCFLSPNYDDAIVVLLRCLTHLASRQESPPNCEAAFVRCLALLALPLPGFRGTFILNFLKNIKPSEAATYKTVWDQKIPQLMKYLEQNYDNFNDSEWKDLICDCLNLLLETVTDELFSKQLVFKTKHQMNLYNNGLIVNGGSGDLSVKQIEKQFLLKCLAMLLCHIKETDIVVQTLDNVFVNAKLTDYSDLHSIAESIGIISKNHLQIVLDKLMTIRKGATLKKSSKFLQFRFIKDQKHEISGERLRYLIINSYAEVCNEAPPEQLLRLVQSEILEFVVEELSNCKDFSIRKACLKAIGAVGDAMHPNRNTLHIRMDERDQILQLVSSQIHLHNGSEYIELFPIILPVITSLIRLPHTLESEQRLKLLKLCFDSVYNASSIYCKINEESVENYYGTLKLVPFVITSFTKLNQLVQELLLMNVSPVTLDEIVTLLEGWLGKRKPEQRLPAAETLRLVLQTYLDNMEFAYECSSTFSQTGFLLSRILPRCTDPNTNIRKVAVESLCLVLCIASRYEGHMRDHDKLLSNSMQYIQQQIEYNDPKLLYNLTTDLGNIICNNMPPFQLIHFVNGLIDALLDCEASSSNGSSIVLNLTMKNKGAELQSHMSLIVQKLLGQLNLIKCPRTKTSALRSVQNSASHHSKIVGSILLQQPLPFEPSICDCWSMLSTDHTLVLDLLDQFKKIVKQTPLYEEQGNGAIKVANIAPLQVICALHEIFKNTQLQEICTQQFPELFSLLLITLSSYIGTSSPAVRSNGDKKDKYFILNRDALKLIPAKIALDTFRLFLFCCDYTQMATSLTTFAHVDNTEDFTIFLDIVSMLVENISEENPQYVSWLVAGLGPYIRAELEPQRIAVVAFFTYLLRQKVHDQTVLAENLLEMILDVQMDSSCFVKQIGLQGLGHAVEHLNSELISRHCNPILSVLMNSLDYNNITNEGSLILEGLLTFSKLLSTLEGQKFSSCQVTAAVRIKPLFSQEDVQLRRASIRLLGDLTQSLSPEASLDAFKEQIHGNLIVLLLHLCDPDQYVVKACKYTLRKVGPYLQSPKVNSMIQEHLIDDANLHYSNFIKDLLKIMGEELQDLFPLLVMTSLSYFKSPWVEIRSNAALMAGLLYSLLNEDNKHRVSADTVCYKLMKLLTDDHEQVRKQSVQAIGHLFLN